MLRNLVRNNHISRYYDMVSIFDKLPEKDPDPEEIKDRIKSGLNALRGE